MFVNYIDTFKSLCHETRNILSLIQKNGPVTKGSIIDLTGLKLSTLSRFMKPLEDRGIVVQCGNDESSGGRRPALYDVNPTGFYIAGIDISRLYAQIVLVNLKMEIIDSYRFPMDKSSTPDMVIHHISDKITAMFNQINSDKKILLGIGTGTVGPLDRKNGVVLNPINFKAPGWLNVPLKKMLQGKLNLPVIIDNGANSAALAEFYFGDGKHHNNMAYFNCGIGIRTGAISSGNLIRTINDTEDAFAHMVIDVDGEQCSCGNFGCIERYCSLLQITKHFTSSLKKGKTTSIDKPIEKIGFKDICDAAEKNDSLSREIVGEAGFIFGTGLANYINLINPELIILSGPLVNSSPLFYETSVETALKKHYLRGNTEILFEKSGKFGGNAISIGSCVLFFESLLGYPNKYIKALKISSI